MANTSILIKRSTTTGTPASLAAGEFAYSYQSNTLFLGSPAGTGVVNVGGQYYTSQVDNATSASTGGTLVRRDANGNAAFGHITATSITASVSGNANSATQFQTDRFINISGGDITASAQLFNGTANATLSASLSAVAGLTAGIYGGTTTVPVLTVAANGRIMSIANSAAISTSIGIAGDAGTDTVSLATDTLTFAGGAGLTSTVTNNTVTLDVDNTVVRSNTASLNQIIDGNVQISGNLSVLGTQTVINTNVLEVKDPLIYLGGNNYVSDIVDIGFVGNYNSGAANLRSGLIRHAGTKEFYAFDSYTGSIDNNSIDVTSGGFNTANLVLNVVKANVIGNYVRTSSVTAPTGNLSVGPAANATVFFSTGNVTVPGKITANGIDLQDYIASAFNAGNAAVTSTSTLTSGAIIIGAGGNNVTTLSNTNFALTGTLGAAKTITSLTVDAYGRVTAATAADISGLTVAQGGTGAATFSNGGLLVGSGTGAIGVLANTNFALTGTLGAAKTLTSLTVDAYGRVTAATSSDISGLTVAQGGTGASTFTSKGIVYGDGTNAMAVTGAAGTADQTFSNQLLTVTNAGVPVWTNTLDGGQF
jgi:hypothetical protein